MKKVTENKDFNKILTGGLVSLIGDQLSLIALPWLVLMMTGNPVYVGLTLGIMGIPRAVLTLLGGGITDKYSPLNVLKICRFLSFVLLLALAGYLYAFAPSMSVIYAFALIFGLLGAVAIPAGMSILPRVVEPEQLSSANGLVMSMVQLSLMIGPVIAGAILGFYGLDIDQELASSAVAEDYTGFAVIFFIDALSFLFSYSMLRSIVLKQGLPPLTESAWHLMKDGFRYLINHKVMTWLMLYAGIISMFVMGPTMVGIPLLVKENFAGDSMMFGTLKTLHGGGALIGSILAIALATKLFKQLGVFVLAADIVIGLLFILFASTTNSWAAHIMVLLIGIIGGIVQVGVFTWVQRNTKPEYMGRIMSYVTFASLGLVPVSAFLSGYIIEWYSVQVLFEFMGVIMASIAVLMLIANTSLRNLHIAAPEPEPSSASSAE